VLLAGRGGLGDPDRVQDGQVISVSKGLPPGLGRGQLLAISVQYASTRALCDPVRVQPASRWK